MTLLSPKLWDDLCFSHAYSTWWSCGLGCVWACGAYKYNSSSSPPYSRWIIYDSFWLIWSVCVSVYHPLLGVERSSIWVDNKRSKYLKLFLSLIISMWCVISQPLYHKLKIQHCLARWVHCLFTAWSMEIWCHLVKNLLCATKNWDMVYMYAFELCMKVVLIWAGFQGH